MPEIWLIIVGGFVLLCIYAFVSARLRARKLRKYREKSLPFIEDNVRPGVLYNVCLSDGRRFECVQLLGCSTVEDGQFLFAWNGMLILKGENGKRIFLKQTAVRYIEEI